MVVALILIFIISSVIQIYFWVYQLDSLNRRVNIEPILRVNQPSISVVIAVKNEYENLSKHLKSWLSQDYTDYEVIIVSDHSIDETDDYVSSVDNERLKFVKLRSEQHGKKAALTVGIEHSSSEWIITTDADCFPNGASWISALMSKSRDADVILGYSPYIYQPTFLNRWISYETWYIAIQYLSAALNKAAYMGVGRNMAFRRDIFDDADGYSSHKNIKSGDDDLFVNALKGHKQFVISTTKDSWVWTYPKSTVKSYISQKRRHLTTAPYYKINTKLWLTGIYLSQVFWYTATIILCIIYPIMIIAILIRAFLLAIIGYRSKSILGENPNFFLVPIFDFLLCIAYFFFSFSFLFPKKEW